MSKLMTATIEEKIPADKLKEIEGKHSCTFTYQGQKCTCGIKDGRLNFYAPEDARPDITTLIDGMENVERQVENMDQLEVYEFLYKVFKTKYRFFKEARKYAIYEVIDEEPLDLESMPLEQRCMMEVLQEQSERARADGCKVYTITREMVENKIEMKLAGGKKQSGR
jgi:hypothetical protein